VQNFKRSCGLFVNFGKDNLACTASLYRCLLCRRVQLDRFVLLASGTTPEGMYVFTEGEKNSHTTIADMRIPPSLPTDVFNVAETMSLGLRKYNGRQPGGGILRCAT
jgi:hypothetical protein